MRLDSLIYCHLIAILLRLGGYEYKLLNKTNIAPDDPHFQHFTDLIRFNNSEGGIRVYVQALVGLASLVTIWRLIIDRNLIDLISTIVSVPFTLWYWTELLPFERSFLTTPYELVYKLIGHHVVFGLFVWTLFSLSLLSARPKYIREPVELLFLNVILGMLIFDLTLDIPLLSDPETSLSLNYGHITNSIGTAMVGKIVPGIMICFLVIVIYRLYQRQLVDGFLFLLFVGALYILSDIVPIEVALHRDGPSRIQQVNIAYAHVVAICVLVFYISVKMTVYYGNLYKYSKHPPLPLISKTEEKTKKE